jgi:hypothetical protein
LSHRDKWYLIGLNNLANSPTTLMWSGQEFLEAFKMGREDRNGTDMSEL